MLTALIGPIANLAGTWLEGKVEKTKAETGAKVARAKAEATIMEKKATGELEWDLEMARGSQSSWKDEWLVILFSVPLILAFIPGMEGVVANGFEQLKAMPQWYHILGGYRCCLFGVRALLSSLGRSKYGRSSWSAYKVKIPPFMMLGMSLMARGGMVHGSEDPTITGCLVSVVTGAMTGAFAVWMGHGTTNEV